MQESFDLSAWDNFRIINTQVSPMSYYDSYLTFKNIVEKLPKKELVKKGWLSDENDVSSLVPLFNEIVDGDFKILFRKNNTANESLIAFWLSKVSMIAKQKIIEQNVPSFIDLSKDVLKELAKMSPNESIILELPNILASHGIILIYEQSIAGMKLDGAVFKLLSGHPVIGISFRYGRLDHFWFTLMHELSHIVLHFGQLDAPIIDNLEGEQNEIIELEANALAKKSFVEKHIWRNCAPKYRLGDESILYSFAREVSIHPSIIAGLLQYENNNYSIYKKITNNDIRKAIFNHE